MDEDREIIADNYQKYDGFVVLHGTDTMSYTASALSFMLENLSKPVIIRDRNYRSRDIVAYRWEGELDYGDRDNGRQENGLPLVPEVCIFLRMIY